jgi:hypothetical protein
VTPHVYLALAGIAILLGIGFGGLASLAGSCSEEARAHKLGASTVPPLLTGTDGNGDGRRADTSRAGV